MNKSVKVWDPFVRLFHWCTAVLFLSNYALLEEGSRPHRYVGYTLIGLVLARILWGFIGTQYARFSSFVPAPQTLKRYLQALAQGQHPYYLSHNPLGALMVVFLLVMLLLTGLSGWLLTQEGFWSDRLMEDIHGTCANLVMVAVGFHIAAVIWISHRTREPLVPAMVHGRKPSAWPPESDHQD